MAKWHFAEHTFKWSSSPTSVHRVPFDRGSEDDDVAAKTAFIAWINASGDFRTPQLTAELQAIQQEVWTAAREHWVLPTYTRTA